MAINSLMGKKFERIFLFKEILINLIIFVFGLLIPFPVLLNLRKIINEIWIKNKELQMI